MTFALTFALLTAVSSAATMAAPPADLPQVGAVKPPVVVAVDAEMAASSEDGRELLRLMPTKIYTLVGESFEMSSLRLTPFLTSCSASNLPGDDVKCETGMHKEGYVLRLKALKVAEDGATFLMALDATLPEQSVTYAANGMTLEFPSYRQVKFTREVVVPAHGPANIEFKVDGTSYHLALRQAK